MTTIPKILTPYLEPPAPYTLGEPSFWQDPHISKGMLAAHLSSETDAASRKPEKIKKSAAWIGKMAELQEGQSLLDLGCGPGLYTQIWAEQGVKVTGMDISSRSLAHATKRAAEANLDTTYIEGNYLADSLPTEMDIITLIYCDFGVLSPADQSRLLVKIKASLNPNGRFIFDVFSLDKLESFDLEPRLLTHESGFWSSAPHTELSQNFIFPGKPYMLSQNVILSEDGSIKVYRRWEHVFTQSDVSELAQAAGLKVESFHENLLGASDTSSKTLATILTHQ